MAAKTNRQIAIELGKEDAKYVLSCKGDEATMQQMVTNLIGFHIKMARQGSGTNRRVFRFTDEDEQAARSAAYEVILASFSS